VTAGNLTVNYLNIRNGTGGGIDNDGNLNAQVTAIRDTFTGNAATVGGGGIYNFNGTTVTNDTFTGNTAPVGGGMENEWVTRSPIRPSCKIRPVQMAAVSRTTTPRRLLAVPSTRTRQRPAAAPSIRNSPRTIRVREPRRCPSREQDRRQPGP